MLQKVIIILLPILVSLPAISFANGGDQRVVDGKYLINLSRAPFTPRVGVKTSMLVSFVDIQKNKLIAEDLIVKVRIAKLGGTGTEKRQFLYEEKSLKVKGGVLELAYTFAETGLHEIFFDFAFASSLEKTHEAPDFLIDVQEEKHPASIQNPWLIIVGTGIVGAIIGFFLKKIKIRKQI